MKLNHAFWQVLLLLTEEGEQGVGAAATTLAHPSCDGIVGPS